MKPSNNKIGMRIEKAMQKASKLLGMFFIVLGYYMLGPFLHSETWQEVKFRLKGMRKKYTNALK